MEAFRKFSTNGLFSLSSLAVHSDLTQEAHPVNYAPDLKVHVFENHMQQSQFTFKIAALCTHHIKPFPLYTSTTKHRKAVHQADSKLNVIHQLYMLWLPGMNCQSWTSTKQDNWLKATFSIQLGSDVKS